MNRKGLGKGLGMGYKNLVPIDSHIHSLSAKGFSQKQSNYMDYVIGKSRAVKKGLITEEQAKKDIGRYKKVFDMDAKGKEGYCQRCGWTQPLSGERYCSVCGSGNITDIREVKFDAKGWKKHSSGVEYRDVQIEGYTMTMVKLPSGYYSLQIPYKENADKPMFDALVYRNQYLYNGKSQKKIIEDVSKFIKDYKNKKPSAYDKWMEEKRMKLNAKGTFQAGEVLRQLGGNRFIAMTGAKNFSRNDEKQQIGFKIGRNPKNINYVRITLNPKDLYDVEFISIRGTNLTVKNKVEDVYNDQLEEIFTENTGLYTRL